MKIDFGSLQEDDPVKIITVKPDDQLRLAKFFKDKGFEVWKVNGKDLNGIDCFHLAFPIPKHYAQELSDLIHHFLVKDFDIHTSATTWNRISWNELQDTYPSEIVVM